MKYLKLFESVDKPKVGDYVKAKWFDHYKDINHIVSKEDEMNKDEIGKIIGINPNGEEYGYIVKYKKRIPHSCRKDLFDVSVLFDFKPDMETDISFYFPEQYEEYLMKKNIYKFNL